MSSKYSGETSSSSASWSWWTVCVFASGIFFGTVIAGMFLYWKFSLKAKFRALLESLPLSFRPHPSPAGHQDTASEQEQPMDSEITKDSPSGQEETAPTHPLDSNIAQGSPSSQEDSTSTHRPDSKILQSIPPSPRPDYTYDVFLSFRGDTRYTFTDHLYHHLTRKGILVFRDDETLNVGETVSPALLQAIRDSKISIVVFSRHYAASTWCLDGMAAIVDCQEELGQYVFPVFYHVDPSHVRNQSGMYEDAFNLHTQRFKEDPGKVDRWRRAMTRLGNLSGWDTRDKPESKVIENITQKLIKTLDHKFSRFADDLVGAQPCVEELEKLLKLEDDDVLVLGICGMGGIGKTTYAKALYGKIFYQFEAACFIQDVSQIYREGGVDIVQKQILSQLIDEQNLEIYNPFKSVIIRRRLSRKQVLIVLDHVDELEQLEKLAVSPKFFGIGSRIIIITRDEHVLKAYGADKIYRVPLLNDSDARKLFLREAFNSNIPGNNSFVELIPKILEFAQNLPLAIRVLGSFLRGRDAAQWEDFLEISKSNFLEIDKVLQVSFETLEPNEKEIFLHIACFFHGEMEEFVMRVLNICGLVPQFGIQVLKDKSLVIIENNKIHMHEMLQELGRKIVREESPGEPGSWSRLWLYKDFEYVLVSETGTDNVKAIVLNQKEDISKCDQLRIEGLSKMEDLQLLVLYHINFSGKLKYLSNNLRYLLWHGYPLPSLPSFEPYSRLVELNLPNSSIKQLWKGRKNFPYLQRVDLSNSEDLMETPNFEGCPNLEQLDFTGCTNLRLLHPSIGLLMKLEILRLRGCTNLVEIPDSIFKLKSLATLELSGCKKLENLKENELKSTKLKEINQQEPSETQFKR